MIESRETPTPGTQGNATRQPDIEDGKSSLVVRNAKTRRQLHGVPELYRADERGICGR